MSCRSADCFTDDSVAYFLPSIHFQRLTDDSPPSCLHSPPDGQLPERPGAAAGGPEEVPAGPASDGDGVLDGLVRPLAGTLQSRLGRWRSVRDRIINTWMKVHWIVSLFLASVLQLWSMSVWSVCFDRAAETESVGVCSFVGSRCRSWIFKKLRPRLHLGLEILSSIVWSIAECSMLWIIKAITIYVQRCDQPDHLTDTLLFTEFRSTLDIVLRSKSSVNLYMFQGGTNFGFMAGANHVDSSPFLLADATCYGMLKWRVIQSRIGVKERLNQVGEITWPCHVTGVPTPPFSSNQALNSYAIFQGVGKSHFTKN